MFDRGRRVHIGDRDFLGALEVAFLQRGAEGHWIKHYDPEKRLWKMTKLDYGVAEAPTGPSLRLEGDDALELYRALHEYFSSRGVKNKDESFVNGELEGTKRHLADLRHLLKLPAKVD